MAEFNYAKKLLALVICAYAGFISACFLFAIFGSMSWDGFWYFVVMGALVPGLTLYIVLRKK
jgi:hypothetical protein